VVGGFLSRWSKRKSGQVQEPPVASENLAKSPEDHHTAQAGQTADAPPPVTLEDVEKIDRFDPDFSAFMRPDVDPQVQQAALKKMFTDPHFNVMDGLDIYIDDYSKPDPLPAGMLERMVQSKMLNLFGKDEVTVKPELNQAEPTPSANKADIKTDSFTLESSSQTDLTSSQSPSSATIADLDAVPLASDKNKT
jgi:Protein of unknown function (DUF3306)